MDNLPGGGGGAPVIEYTEALADIEKLEQEIRSTYELNPAFMIG